MKKNIIVLFVLFAVASLGCEKLYEAVENKAQENAANNPAGPGPVDPMAKETDELNGYVDCYNRVQKRTIDSMNRYYSYVPREEGPDCDKSKGDLHTLYEDSVELCNNAAKNGAAGGPSWPGLEAAAKELAAANAEIVPLTQKANDYWSQEDYKDDECKAGKEMHTQLVASFDRFQAALYTFEVELKVIKLESDRRALQGIEKMRGKNIEWQHRNFMLSARALIDTIPMSAKDPIPVDQYLAAYDVVEKDQEALVSYTEGHKAEVDEVVFMGSGFERYVKEFYKAAKFLRRELEAEKQDPEKINELVTELIDEYNDLIDNSNRISYRYQN